MVLFVHNTSHVKTDPYDNLLREKGFGGFPTVAFLTSDGSIAGVVEGKRTIEGFNEALTKAQTYAKDVIAKAQAGDAAASKQLLLDNIKRGSMKLADAKKAAASVKDLTAAEKAQVESGLVNLEFNEITATVKSQADMPDAGRKLVAMKAAGRIPTGRSASSFWNFIMAAAEKDKDVKLAEEVVEAVKKMAADNPQMQRTVDAMQQRVDKLKGDGDKK